MKKIISKCAELSGAGKRTILVAPLKRIPELRGMLLEAGMTSAVLAGHVTHDQRAKIIAEASLVITPPVCISTGVSLKGFNALFCCWKEEIQGQHLDILEARWGAAVMDRQVQRNFAIHL